MEENYLITIKGTMEQTLDLGWELLATLPRNALDRCDAATLDKYYEPAKARISKK